MKKVIVIGCAGAGKSYFSKKLHAKTGIPLYHLDLIWHKPDKTHISRTEFDETLNRIFEDDSWILDGDYSRTLEMRMQKCDTVFFFDFPYELCIQGIKEREGTKRDDIPWEVAEADPALLDKVKNYITNLRPIIYALMEKYKEEKTFYIFHTRQDAHKWLL